MVLTILWHRGYTDEHGKLAREKGERILGASDSRQILCFFSSFIEDGSGLTDQL